MEEPNVNKTPEEEVFQEMGGNSRGETVAYLTKLAQQSAMGGGELPSQLLGLAERVERGELSSEDARREADVLFLRRPESSQ